MRLVTWNVNSLMIDLAHVSDACAGRRTHAGMERTYRTGSRPSGHAPPLVEWNG